MSIRSTLQIEERSVRAGRVLVVQGDPDVRAELAAMLARSETRSVATPRRRHDDPAPATRDMPPRSAPLFRVGHAEQSSEALAMVGQALDTADAFDVAFVDLPEPPGADGLETIGRLWEIDPELQVVACTRHTERAWAESIGSLGHDDRLLLLKEPFDRDEVWQAALAMARKRAIARAAAARIEDLRQQACAAVAKLDEQIRLRSEVEEELRHLAYHDPVTGLPNRTYLFDRIEQCIQRSHRHPQFRYAVLYIDLDNFKLINDTMGHDRGDRLLQDVAQRLRACMRSIDAIAKVEEDVAARVGGDEFIVLLEGIRDSSDSVRVAERFLEVLSRPFRIDGKELIVCGSIGIATSDRQYSVGQDVLRDADTAMYRAKSMGKGRAALFDPEMHAAAKHRLEIENRLRDAVTKERMQLSYQPIVDTRTQELIGFEALFRCRLHGVRADPQEVINVAEETGLIIPIGRWVFRRACEDLRRWREAHPKARRLRMNINTSRRELADGGLVDHARTVLGDNYIPPDRVVVEVTESGIIRDADAALEQLQSLRDVGVGLHMDDFGTGYSSLACLHAYPLNGVKIDRAFTAMMISDQRYIAVVKAIVTLCRTLSMSVTVEGIETPEQLELVDSLGCDCVQGYMFAKPMTPEQVDELLSSGDGLRLAA